MVKKLVYVAGPYSHGDTNRNVQRALAAGDMIYQIGALPFVPHLSHLWDLVDPRPYEHWMDLDKDYLELCDAVFVLPGFSPGADNEIVRAKELGIPVFTDYVVLENWLKDQLRQAS